jgi:hypothetical protein
MISEADRELKRNQYPIAFGLLRPERCSGERQTVYSARRKAEL